VAADGIDGIDGSRRVSFAPARSSGAWKELGQHAGAPRDHISAAAEPASSAVLQHHVSGDARGRAAAALPPPAALAAGSVAGQPKQSRRRYGYGRRRRCCCGVRGSRGQLLTGMDAVRLSERCWRGDRHYSLAQD